MSAGRRDDSRVMHLLVTGAGGYVGRELCRRFLDDGITVTAATRRDAALRDLPAGDNLRHAVFDMAEPWPDLPAVDGVIHAGAQSRPDGPAVETYMRDNVMATGRLLTWMKTSGTKRVIFLSSISVFGKIAASRVDETTPSVSAGAYGMSKHLCEMALAEASDTIASLSVRLPGVLGPGAMTPWLAKVLDAAIRGADISIFNPDQPFNNAVHVDDLAKWFGAAMRRDMAGADMLVLGAGGRTTVHEAVETLIGRAGSSSTVRVEPSDRASFSIDCTKAAGIYGYAPMDIDDMLRRFVSENSSPDAHVA